MVQTSALIQPRFHKDLYGPLEPAVLVLENGAIFPGWGIGATGEVVGELCFNTAMTGYQETLSDPSYAQQIVVFTYPHIGNVGCNPEDDESSQPKALGCVLGTLPTHASNWRSQDNLTSWLQRHQLIGIAGIDTRDLTCLLRDHGAMKAGLAHGAETCVSYQQWKPEALLPKVHAWSGLANYDLATTVGRRMQEDRTGLTHATKHIVVIDFGVKESMIQTLNSLGINVTIVPAMTSFEAILAIGADGVLLSNGPGDPAATYKAVEKTITGLIDHRIPCFGICLGFQLLCLGLDGKSFKLRFGHHGSNHPVHNLMTKTVQITAQNHGFAIDPASLPADIAITHRSLFDGTCEGICSQERKILAVQYHPEASPGPRESRIHFQEFLSWL